jgi:plasmid maintenance system antidote protein VapI
VHTMELLLEEFSEHRQNMRSLAQMMDLCVKQIETMVEVSDVLKRMVVEVQRQVQEKDQP